LVITARLQDTAFGTLLHEQGYNTAWIELQLAHVDKNTIRGTYNHAQYLEQRREMLQWYANYMGSLEQGGSVVHGEFGRLYDRTDLIPFAKLTSFFNDNLK
jgi:hypothetical protein